MTEQIAGAMLVVGLLVWMGRRSRERDRMRAALAEEEREEQMRLARQYEADVLELLDALDEDPYGSAAHLPTSSDYRPKRGEVVVFAFPCIMERTVRNKPSLEAGELVLTSKRIQFLPYDGKAWGKTWGSVAGWTDRSHLSITVQPTSGGSATFTTVTPEQPASSMQVTAAIMGLASNWQPPPDFDIRTE